MAHDSCIFSGMDGRQKATIFKIVIELIKENELQYFINIGQNSLEEILNQGILTETEKDFVKDNIILELYDKHSSNWLFGESFD